MLTNFLVEIAEPVQQRLWSISRGVSRSHPSEQHWIISFINSLSSRRVAITLSRLVSSYDNSKWIWRNLGSMWDARLYRAWRNSLRFVWSKRSRDFFPYSIWNYSRLIFMISITLDIDYQFWFFFWMLLCFFHCLNSCFTLSPNFVSNFWIFGSITARQYPSFRCKS